MAFVSKRERLDPAHHVNACEPAQSATSAVPVTSVVQ